MLDIEGDQESDLSDYDKDQLNYHKALIIEAGFVEGNPHYTTTKQTDIPDVVIIKRITWEGHEFLDKARSEKVWSKAKELVKKKTGTLSLEALKVGLSEVIEGLMY